MCGKESWIEFQRTRSRSNCDLRPQGNITGLTGLMDFKDNGSNAHVQFEILGSSFSETFGKDIKRVSSHRFTSEDWRRACGCPPAVESRLRQQRSSKEGRCRLAVR